MWAAAAKTPAATQTSVRLTFVIQSSFGLLTRPLVIARLRLNRNQDGGEWRPRRSVKRNFPHRAASLSPVFRRRDVRKPHFAAFLGLSAWHRQCNVWTRRDRSGQAVVGSRPGGRNGSDRERFGLRPESALGLRDQAPRLRPARENHELLLRRSRHAQRQRDAGSIPH